MNRRSPARRVLAARLAAMAIVASVGAAAAQTPGEAGGPPLVLRGATLIDGRGGAPVPDAVVTVVDGRIRAVGSEAGEPAAPPPGAVVRDLDGGFLIPGLVDAHAHVALGPVALALEEGVPVPRVVPDPEVAPRSLRTLLAFGVTTARDPGGPTAETVRIRDAVARGELVGPRLVVAGHVIDTSRFDGLVATVATAEQVRAEVRRQAAAGVDLIKLYAGLDPELIRAGVEQARVQGLPAVAHLMRTTWTEGSELGLHTVLHIVPGSPELLPEDEREAYRAEMAGTIFFATWFERADFDGPEMQRAIATLARNRTWVDPTLVVFEAALFGDRPERSTAVEHLELAAPSLVENWRSSFRFDLGWSAASYERARRAWPKVLELVRRLHQAGVRLTAGTDANNPWTVPGPSLHRELELLAAAGIPPGEVLRIATRNGAEALGLLDETGTLEPGKRADLVLLRENPLTDPSATRSIEWVMKDGVLHRPAELLTAVGVPGGPTGGPGSAR